MSTVTRGPTQFVDSGLEFKMPKLNVESPTCPRSPLSRAHWLLCSVTHSCPVFGSESFEGVFRDRTLVR